MATLALDAIVHAFALEARVQIVIELGRAAGGLVAFRAVITENLDVHVIFFVAVVALHAFHLKRATGMAAVAVHRLVKASEVEAGIAVVVEDQRLKVCPAGMTLAAVLTEFATMNVNVACKTLRLLARVLHRLATLRRVTEMCRLMAALAVDGLVRPFQRESSQ